MARSSLGIRCSLQSGCLPSLSCPAQPVPTGEAERRCRGDSLRPPVACERDALGPGAAAPCGDPRSRPCSSAVTAATPQCPGRGGLTGGGGRPSAVTHTRGDARSGRRVFFRTPASPGGRGGASAFDGIARRQTSRSTARTARTITFSKRNRVQCQSPELPEWLSRGHKPSAPSQGPGHTTLGCRRSLPGCGQSRPASSGAAWCPPPVALCPPAHPACKRA